jgi:hypothetical protein
MASNLVQLGIPSIAVALAGTFVCGVARAASNQGVDARGARRQAVLAALGVAGFMGGIALLALSGLLARFDLRPPPLMLWMVSTLGVALGVGLSRMGRRLAEGLPLAALVGFQVFRLPLELVMHRAALEGVMPSVMSYGGYNFDILSGITAGLLGLALFRGSVPRGLVVAWNALGLTLLGVIVTVAFLATPLVRAFGDQQLNSWITQFPYAWMAVMVSSALLGHVLVARKLMLATTRPGSGSARSLAGATL